MVVTNVQTENSGRNTHPGGNPIPTQSQVTAGWPPYGLPLGYMPLISGFAPQFDLEWQHFDNMYIESYHDLVNLLTQQMTTIVNPVMADHETKGRKNPQFIPGSQNADDVLVRLRANQVGERYQVSRIVENVLNRVGFNVGFMNRPHFMSTFSPTVQMAEVPRGIKNPKIVTMFAGEVGESTTKHVARYLVEIGNLANDENLKMKFFPSSLMKNTFTWFSNLRPNSITTWAQLENAFHAQFYRREMNEAVTDLVALKCEDSKNIDDYMICFKN
ncbi:uncharacterized protein LOC110274778 [Arachis duranensis]|uniref:Uncharacterized protein LOC110274778 n=1 Tax=Arachis duranensis TaxID=130453 RepID=A0A6P5MRC3_ARADU|nr:uncharacterized protein LOC110274778 [Arachis duranensis]